MNTAFQPSMLLAFVPEIGLLVLGGIVLTLDLLWQDRRCRNLGWMTSAGLLLLMGLSVVLAWPGEQAQLMWGGMLRFDAAGYVFRMIFLAGAALTILLSMRGEQRCMSGEYFVLILVSTFGMCLMASAADLIMLYLAIETTAVPLYILAGFLTREEKSVEAGLKYLLYGAMTSAVMLYGFSLLYGFGGTTQLYTLGERLQAGQLPVFALLGAAMLVLVGLGFKISAVPLHFWAPDVYEGAPTPVAGFLSTASKAAGFVALMRVLLAVFPTLLPDWQLIVAALAAASMLVGNLLALAQKNVKRLLAYSSIAQAGYILIGVAAGNTLGNAGAIYYLMAYLLTNLAAFGVVSVVGRRLGSDEVDAYAGLSRRSPALAFVMLVALLSLGGIPPFAGFVGKLLVLAAAVQTGGGWLLGLAAWGALNSILALYYYLNLLKVIYLYRSEGDVQPLTLAPSWVVALVVCGVGIVVLGTLIGPAYGWAASAASVLRVY